MTILTYEELHRQLDYVPFTGNLHWKVVPDTLHWKVIGIKIGDIAGTNSKDGYIRISINGERYLAHRLAWFWVYGYMPEYGLDHKKGIKWDNRIRRLREVSQSCNLKNCGNPKDNTSTVKGVYWYEYKNKWLAGITVNKSTKHLGYHKNFAEAVCHRLAAEQCVGWEKCDDNSPAFQYVQKMLNKTKEGS